MACSQGKSYTRGQKVFLCNKERYFIDWLLALKHELSIVLDHVYNAVHHGHSIWCATCIFHILKIKSHMPINLMSSPASHPIRGYA